MLDIGAGAGFTSKAFLESGHEVEAWETSNISREMFKRLNGFYPENNFLGNHAFGSNQNFDFIILSQVLEHITFQTDPCKKLHELCSPTGGLVLVSVPNLSSIMSKILRQRDFFIIPPEHVNFFTIKSLNACMQRAGFDVIHYESTSRFDPRRFQRLGLLGPLAAILLKIALQIADKLGMGLFLTAVYRPRTRA